MALRRPLIGQVFLENGYKQKSKDKSEDNKISYCAITVDDCFFAAIRDDKGIQYSIDMLKGAFEELALVREDVITFSG